MRPVCPVKGSLRYRAYEASAPNQAMLVPYKPSWNSTCPGGSAGQRGRSSHLSLWSRTELGEGLLLGACQIWSILAGGLFQSPAPTPLPHCPLPLNSKLRPPLDLKRKSRLLSVCLCSVFALPLMDVLKKHTCLFLEPPNIQV